MHERARFAGILASVAVVYVLAGVVGLSFADLHPAVTPIWPSAGIAVASLLVLGLRVWPAVALGAFITNLIAFSGDARLAAAIAAGNTLEAIAGIALATRFANGRLAFERGPDVFRFTFIAALGATLISAGIGILAIGLADQIPAGTGWRLWITWWLGNATGMALYTPFCVLLATRHEPPRAGSKELMALAAALVLV